MADGNSETALCEQFGFDAEWRAAQLLLVDLAECPHDLLGWLHEQVLVPDVVEGIVDRFFEQLRRHPQADKLLSSFDLQHLKQRQIEHFGQFGANCNEADYFELRTRVGIAHARVGVPLSLYLSGFGLLQTLILAAIVERVGDDGGRQALSRLVMQLTTLDIALATEVYHRAQSAERERSVRHRERGPLLLRRQLEHDALTGVSSRASLLQELATAMERATKTGQPLCVIVADLDHFKTLNDSHGYAAGDRILKEVAARLKAALREFDVVGRYGGEEFVILLDNTSLHTALQVAERMRQRIAGAPLDAEGLNLQLTITQGLAAYRDGDDSHSLLQRADAAMLRAKQQGRNRVAGDPGHAARS
jgi:two-component system cell cycle response regulator